MRSISASELPPGRYSVVEVDPSKWTTAEKQRLLDDVRARCGLVLTMDVFKNPNFPECYGSALEDEITSIASSLGAATRGAGPFLPFRPTESRSTTHRAPAQALRQLWQFPI